MDRFIAGPAAKDFRAIARKGQSVKGLLDSGSANLFARSDFDDGDFMLSMATVEDGGELPAWVHRDIHREIPQRDLFAYRAQEPLVRQSHRAVGLLAGQINVARLNRPPGRGAAGKNEQAQNGHPGHRVSHTYSRVLWQQWAPR